MIDLKENINNFLFYLDKVRGYASSSIVTYDNVLIEMIKVSHFYKEDEKNILDITPLRLKIVNNSKKTISKKVSAIRSFIKYMNEQEEVSIELLGDSVVKVPQTLPKLLDKTIIDEVLFKCNKQESLILTLLYALGLRISELSRLQLENIAPEWVTVIGKGDKERNIPLLPSIYSEIELYKQYEGPRKFLLEKNGKQMTTSQIRYLFSKIFKKSTINATEDQLRHSLATHLLHNGARVSMVSTQIYTQLENSKKLNEYSKAHPLCVSSNNNIGELDE